MRLKLTEQFNLLTQSLVCYLDVLTSITQHYKVNILELHDG